MNVNTTELVEKVNAQVNEVVKASQEQATKAIAEWTETIEGFLPETVTDLDIVENLPKPEALVEMAFDFTEKVLAYQADLARSIAGMVDELLPKAEQAAPAKPAAKAKAKAATKA